MTDPAALRPLLEEATDRLLATVDALDADAFAQPSALPDWSRGHVVAHLTLNAEGLAAALTGVARDVEVPMYASQIARDAEIDDLAPRPPAELRARLRAATRGLVGALGMVPPESWSAQIRRVPDASATFLAADVPHMRWREVEIHHVDLAAGYARDAWPVEFGIELVDAAADRLTRGTLDTTAPGFTMRATDVDKGWDLGEGPLVSGTVADLGWWLTGRGGEDRLSVSGGPMPTIGKW